MATTETMQMAALGERGEPCGGCGALLAADQRYCLNCGQRRAGPRVDFRHYVSSQALSPASVAPSQEPQVAPPTSPEPKKSERDYAPLAAVGGIAVLGLMLLVGVLIGRGNNTTTSAPAPIVRVGGAATGAARTSTDSGKSSATSSKKASAGGSSKTGATKVKGGLTGSAARNAKQPVQATAGNLKSLNNQSGSSYENSIKKLPDKIATPGKPPPVDTSKAPGGGGAAQTIK